MVYRELDETELSALQERLHSAARLWGWNGSPSFALLQRKYDALLAERAPSDDEIDLLGYAFGTKLISVGWLDWAIQLDHEYGDTIAVAVTDLELGCCPLSMIRNRLDDQESADLAELAEATFHRLRQLSQHANNRRG